MKKLKTQEAIDNHFTKKMVKNLGVATALLVISLAIGMIGYHNFLNLSWVDSLVNASMILTGMGPVDKAFDDYGKIFSSFYAIYSGVAFLTSVAFLASPIFHKVLHMFHMDLEEDN